MDKKNIRDLAIEVGLQSIPYVGGPIATVYFGIKQEKRFKRLETFYVELKELLDQVKAKPPSVASHDEESLALIIEKINDQVEKEHIERKRAAYKIYFLKTLYDPVTMQNFDQRLLFLDILKSITETQLDIFAFLVKENKPMIDKSIISPGISTSLIQGSIGQLKIMGLLDSRLQSIVISSNSNINEMITVSDLGREFHYFCMT